jgi:hypothetical protein
MFSSLMDGQGFAGLTKEQKGKVNSRSGVIETKTSNNLYYQLWVGKIRV